MAANADKAGKFEDKFNGEPGLTPIEAQNYKGEKIGLFSHEKWLNITKDKAINYGYHIHMFYM